MNPRQYFDNELGKLRERMQAEEPLVSLIDEVRELAAQMFADEDASTERCERAAKNFELYQCSAEERERLEAARLSGDSNLMIETWITVKLSTIEKRLDVFYNNLNERLDRQALATRERIEELEGDDSIDDRIEALEEWVDKPQVSQHRTMIAAISHKVDALGDATRITVDALEAKIDALENAKREEGTIGHVMEMANQIKNIIDGLKQVEGSEIAKQIARLADLDYLLFGEKGSEGIEPGLIRRVDQRLDRLNDKINSRAARFKVVEHKIDSTHGPDYAAARVVDRLAKLETAIDKDNRLTYTDVEERLAKLERSKELLHLLETTVGKLVVQVDANEDERLKTYRKLDVSMRTHVDQARALAQDLLTETLHGPPPVQTTMLVAQALVFLYDTVYPEGGD